MNRTKVFIGTILIIGGGIILLGFGKNKKMSNDDYIEVFKQNRESFYIAAKALEYCEEGLSIDLDGNTVTGNDKYQACEEKESAEFSEAVSHLNQTGMIKEIYVGEQHVEFVVKNPPKNYRVRFDYSGSKTIKEYPSFATYMEDHWVLEVIPNT